MAAVAAALALEPLAPLGSQPLWQAPEPVSVNVEYDVKRAFTALSENARDVHVLCGSSTSARGNA